MPRCATPTTRLSAERGYRLATEPKVTLPTEQEAIEKLMSGESDLDYTMALEIVPPITLADFTTINLTQIDQRSHRRRSG